MSASIRGGVFSLENVSARLLKISAINALGKVTYQRAFYEINGSVSIDLAKATGHSASFVRISADGANQTYIVKGKNVLLKEGDLLPSLGFSLEGYQSTTYQMKAEVETDVVIKMERASATQNSSSSVMGQSSSNTAPKSSAAEVKSSSSQAAETPIDCSGKTAKAGDQNMSIKIDGRDRTFIMHVPSAYKGDKAVPLVVDYHSVNGSGSGEMGMSPYKGKTDPEGVITLYPDGIGKSGTMWSAGWNVGPCCSDGDDVKFSREMIKKVEEIACIDPKRVYATGFSMGGGMSNHVACNMSDIYAAVAPAAMDLNKENSSKCSPTRPISVIMFRGTNDGTCKYDGGPSGYNDGLDFLGAKGNFKFWGEKNGCNTASSIKNSDGCDEYPDCKDGVRVVLCTAQGGGHSPGDANIGWPFLKSFTMP
jgi:polyhydroxybutyrate depolymerase